MRDYGKVYSTFWSSDTTGGLSDDAKLLALYLLTCSHSTIAGVFRLPDGYVSEDLQWTGERVAKGFGELFRKGFANRCETTKWVWVKKHLEWNKPENPNQCKAAAKVARSVPDQCVWKRDFWRDSAEVLTLEALPPENPCETVTGTVEEGFRNQKQKQEQKQDQEQEKGERRSQATRPSSPRSKSESMTLATYLANCKAAGQKPVPDGHAIRRWCADAGIAAEMLQVAWVLFRERYTEGEKGKAKRYKDWPAHFATAVKDNWAGLWFMGDDNCPAWTSKGLTHKAVLDARMGREAAHG